MKKFVVMILLIVGYCHAQDIPSLSSLFKEQQEFIKSISPESAALRKDNTTEDLFNTITRHFLSAEMNPGLIQDTLTQWYNENPTLFRGTILSKSYEDSVLNNLPFSLADAFAKELYVKEYVSPDILANPNRQAWFKKVAEIVRVLNKLGIAHMLSNEQLHMMAKIDASQIEAAAKLMNSRFMEMIEKRLED